MTFEQLHCKTKNPFALSALFRGYVIVFDPAHSKSHREGGAPRRPDILFLLHPQHRRRLRVNRVGLKIAPLQKGEPMFNHRQNRRHGQALVRAGVLAEIRAGQFEQGGGRPKPILLQVNERPRQLNQTLVKRAVGPVPIFEPKLFQNIVRLVNCRD